ncbi:hypothetical protein KC851_03370 [Candidatus Kaiserbacteria bacterium]|nr:hypothetical protein [Candidatus Kaiserbacteria bacterium]
MNGESEVSIQEKSRFLPALIAVLILFILTAIMLLIWNINSSALKQPEATENTSPVTVEDYVEPFAEGGFVSTYTSEVGDVYFTDSTTGLTLYQKTEGFCLDSCLEVWVPYAIDEEIKGERFKSVLVNEDHQLYYLLLDDKMLFTFYGELGAGDLYPGDAKGDGYEGEWTIARP